MGWPQLGIHMICVGLPIAWGVRRAPADRSDVYFASGSGRS
jgi:hypothetical protein